MALLGLGAACAPAASFRPASALSNGRANEIGAGGVVIGKRPYVDEPAAGVGQAWGTHAVGEFVRVSLVTAFDAEALAGGFVLTVLPWQSNRIDAGIDVELGFAWAGVALPLAVRTVGPTWLYASPRLGTWGDRLTPGLPFGLDVHLGDDVSARAECQLSWADFVANNRRVLFGLAVAYAFGAPPTAPTP